MNLDSPAMKTLINSHEKWLRNYCAEYTNKWKKLLVQHRESALAEAWVHEFIDNHVRKVEPSDIPDKGGPEFLCLAKDNTTEFFVEVTNLDTTALSKRTGLPESIHDWEGGSIKNLTDKFSHRLKRKRKQLTGLDRPIVLAITAFHETVTFAHFGSTGVHGLLIPPTERIVQISYGNAAGQQESWESPMFGRMPFFNLGDGPKSYKKSCTDISAILLCAVPWQSSSTGQAAVDLVLNPTADPQFNPDWLSEVRCSRLQDNWADTDPCKWKVVLCGKGMV